MPRILTHSGYRCVVLPALAVVLGCGPKYPAQRPAAISAQRPAAISAQRPAAISAQQPAAISTSVIPSGPRVYTPDAPAASKDDTPGTHTIKSENKWGDHMQTSYTIPPLQPVSLPPGRVSIDDPRLGISSGAMDLPSGWTFEGSIHRDIPCGLNVAEPAFRLTSPDGIVLEMMTPFFLRSSDTGQASWTGSGCGVTTTEKLSTADILTRYILPSLQPGDTMIGKPEPTPGSEDWVRHASAQLQGGTTTGEDMRVRVKLQRDGRSEEAWIGAQTVFFHGATPVVTGTASEPRYEASITTVFRVIAPPGRLDEAVRIGNGLHLDADPAWLKKEQGRRAGGGAALLQHDRPPYPSIEEGRRPHMIDPGYHPGDYNDYVGDARPTAHTVWYWRNTATGAYRSTDTNVSPGTDWTPAK